MGAFWAGNPLDWQGVFACNKKMDHKYFVRILNNIKILITIFVSYR